MFGKLVRSFRIKNGLSQTVFVDMVQRSSAKFDSLDVVTLSRWERGVTKPHLTRQNNLLELLGVDIFDVWEGESKANPISRKVNANSYIDESSENNIKVVVINATNLSQLNKYLQLVDVIFDSDKNFILSKLNEVGARRISTMEKILELHSSEMVLVTVHGQLVGHLISVDSNELSSRFKIPLEKDEPVRLILSFNATTQFSFVATLGREVYKLVQSLNPEKKLSVFVKDKAMFDILYNLGFSYKTFGGANNRQKLMMLTKDKVKSERVWMQIVRGYKGE
ncbi:helix-turn-helix domain-containing protein [Vibrio coralliirubri]|uniref:helix-turn-helix domain-containing protein n=1 Tax=Vibrio coralliirubri TaxID=1516159 RepID=UPI000A361BFF|nr:helix-turn-helix transcriptional regulator [Vibrio coralliirubri]